MLRIASNAEWNVQPVDPIAQGEGIMKRMDSLGLIEPWMEIEKNSSAKALDVALTLLASKRFEASPVLTAAALGLLLEHVQRDGSLKDPALVTEMAISLQEPIASDVLNKHLQTELRRPLDADALRTLVKSVDEWRPKTERITRPTRAVAPGKAAARKTATKKTTPSSKKA